jgi:predicted nucleic acid-binding protein
VTGHAPHKLMLMDACVLIDFIKTEQAVLELVGTYVGTLHVISPVMDEIHDIESWSELEDIGLIIIEPEMEDAYAAGSKVGPLSFPDWLCLLTAKRHGFTCVTNDKNLRRFCSQEEISLLWGLQLVAMLHKAGGIPGKDAVALGKAIRRSNPRHITENIVARFMDTIRRQEGHNQRP